MQRLCNTIVSEKLGSQTIETDTTFSQIESPDNGQDNPRGNDIYSFIEIKVKEVCRLEIEKLKQEAITSYSDETIASLREENNLLNIRRQELQSRNDSLRKEARGAFHSTQNSGNFGWYIKWNGPFWFGQTGIFGTSLKGGPL